MAVWTGSGADTEICNLNLPCGHAYTLVKAVQATKKDGTVVQLYQVRNPWGIETQSDGSDAFNGTYNDQASIWTSDPNFAAQVGWWSGNDGYVWVTGPELLATFVYMQITEYRDGWVQSIYSAEGVTTAS